jgi:hypothetical protein
MKWVEYRVGKDLEGSGHGIMEALPGVWMEGLRNVTKYGSQDSRYPD